MIIHFASSDGQIWNKDQLIVNVMYQIQQKYSQIIVSALGEGPCAQDVGLYDILDLVCSTTGYACENIMIRTCNLIERHPRYQIQIDPQTVYLLEARQFHIDQHLKNWNHGLKHFGNFVGHGNYPRLLLASYLKNTYADKAVQTYHYTLGDYYHRPFVGIEDLLFHRQGWNVVDQALALLRSAPLTHDTINSYPILKPTTFNITKIYPDFFVEICCLSYFSGNTFYIDEKIWRPILMKTPFLVQGPKHFLTRLRHLGFRTFDAWWNEGYSEDSTEDQLTAITKIIDDIALWDQQTLKSVYCEMQEVLDHNYERMMTLTSAELDVF